MGVLKNDLTGNTYDNWVAIEYLGKSNYKCKCKLCGAERTINGYFLKNGKIPKCTCVTGRANSMGLIDLKGKTFGEWYVIEYAGDRKWKCRCSCGREQIIAGSDLRSGKTTKCNFTHTHGAENTYRKEKDFAELTSGALDLYNKTFGDWEVLYYIGNSMWKCKCSCGTVRAVSEYSLISGSSRSCGHATTGLKDLTGKDFEYWHVIERVDTSGNYLCKCKCGTEKIVNRYALLTGQSKSCGCKANENRRNTLIDRFGVYAVSQIGTQRTQEQLAVTDDKEKLLALINKIKKANGYITIYDLTQELNIDRGSMYKYLDKYGLLTDVSMKNRSSHYERDILKLFPGGELNNRTVLSGLEIDIWYPDIRLGIEFNGNFWHSEGKRGKQYHKQKELLAIDKGIRLIQIFEYEWNNADYREKLINYISDIFNSNKRVEYARNCTVKEVSNEIAYSLESKYHLQGYARADINLGMYNKNNELLGIMSFGRPRFNQNYSTELIRLCWKTGVTVIGGSNKLFEYFIENYNVDTIISYCDISKFSGMIYNKLGFELDGFTDPSYVWIKDNAHVFKRYETQKEKLVSKGICKQCETEVQAMTRLGYYRLYDCGNARYIWKRN